MSGDDAIQAERRPPLEPLPSMCFVPSKSSGLVSVCIQFAVLVVSALVCIFFFYHIVPPEAWGELGGIRNFVSTHTNETLIGTVKDSLPELPDSLETATLPLSDEVSSLFNRSKESTSGGGDVEIQPSDEDEDMYFSNTTIEIEPLVEPVKGDQSELKGAQVDMLELIRISTLVYIGICCLWLISLISLLLSVKCEVLDLVVLNAFMLTIAMFYTLIHALFVAVLLYYQHDVPWRTAAVVIGTVIVLVLTACVCGFTLALVVAWYKYIVYVRDSDKCVCIAAVVHLVKGRKRGRERGAQEYSLPEIAHNNNNSNRIPYADGPPIQQFSHF